jgi:hypothetical protein
VCIDNTVDHKRFTKFQIFGENIEMQRQKLAAVAAAMFLLLTSLYMRKGKVLTEFRDHISTGNDLRYLEGGIGLSFR